MATGGDHHPVLGAARLDGSQSALLERCVAAGDATAWNEWRQANPEAEVWLQGLRLRPPGEGRATLRRADLSGAHLDRASLPRAVLVGADLRDASLIGATLSEAILVDCTLRGADLREADLRGTNLRGADLRATHAAFAKVDGETLIVTPRVDHDTDLTGVALDAARVEPGLKQLLEYNIRRKRWGAWYYEHRVLAPPVWLFWLACDYGNSTWRILISFAVLAVAFAVAYLLLPGCVVVSAPGHEGGLADFGHALYFSIVTMTTLGFGDAYASPTSHLGQFLLSLQVTLGYVLLGALVTRFAVLFAAGGPAARFFRDKGESASQR